MKYVFTLDPAIAKANGKDPAATELLKVMGTYGKVETFDRVMAATEAEHKATVDSLVAQIDALEAHNLTPAQLEVLDALRAFETKVTQSFKDENNMLRGQLEEVKDEEEARAKIIIEALNRKIK
jgi:capsule polysaccharide modification protein KpsS